MTEEDVPRATPTKKLFTNFKVYMHTWFPFKEEVEDAITYTTQNMNEAINDDISIIRNELSKKANTTDIPHYISELENDDNFLTQNDVKNNLTSTDSNLPLSANQGKLLKEYIDEKFNEILDVTYPIGSIYMSVTNQNPSMLFGGTWEQLQNRFLLGAGNQYSNGATGGSKDAVVIYHTHIQNSHNHSQNSHTHDQNSHSHDPSTSKYTLNFVTCEDSEAANYEIATSSSSDVYADAKPHKYFHHRSNSGSTTATNKNTTATNVSTTATNQYTGESGTNKNMPPYLVVYMWKRIA